jgi:hypothetical protein
MVERHSLLWEIDEMLTECSQKYGRQGAILAAGAQCYL